jgi:hypothetical protein
MYGGRHATAYFVRETRKSTWFTQVPVVLSKCSGAPEFGAEWSVQISRAGDYLLQTWLRVELPRVEVQVDSQLDAEVRIRWTRNVGHALIKECCLTFNDLVAARFDNYHLDFWTAFTTPASKRVGYDNMIGNIAPLTGFGANSQASSGGVAVLETHMLNVPLPFFYTRDSGVALPTAALPYNDMRIQFQFRQLDELLITDVCSGQVGAGNETTSCGLPKGVTYVGGTPRLTRVAVWANYAIVSNDERKRMACAPRDILIEQVQTAPPCGFHPKATTTPEQYDVRFSHAIKALFFAVRNKTLACEHANYTTSPAEANFAAGAAGVNLAPAGAFDPIREASLLYENTVRLGCMGSDFYSLVEPYYKAPAIPEITGYHMYSYSLDFYELDPMGSTNFGKLTNVGLRVCPSQQAVDAAAGDLENLGDCDRDDKYPEQKFEFVVTAVNNNIVRISGGALGFPVL